MFKSQRTIGLLDEFWNNLVLGVVGGTIEPNDLITGVRLVDKMTASNIKSPLIRFEIWFQNPTSTKNPELAEKIKNGEIERHEIVAKLEASIKKHMLTKLDGTYVPENEIWAQPVDQREHS